MMKLLFPVLLLLSMSAQATNYYFSNAGSDGAAGTFAAPWQTIAKFNSYFASLAPGDSVLFRRGDTFAGSLNISRSGSSGNNIIIGAYGTGAAPSITGLATLTSWTNIGSGLYEKTLPSPPAHSLNIVLFDGALQPIGRYPKEGLGNSSYFTISTSYTSSMQWPNSEGTVKSTGISGIPNFVGGEVVYKPFQWIINRATVMSQGTDSVRFNSTIPQFGGASLEFPLGVTTPPTNGHGFFFQNHINTLTTLGDWAYNQSTKKITMYFGAVDPTTRTVQVATIDSLVQIKGGKSYISIIDISLTGANEYAINLDTATYLAFTNLSVNFVGINGINARTSSQTTHHGTVDNCTFNNILNNGIDLSSSPNWNITNNYIQNIAAITGMGLGDNGQYIGIYNVGANSRVEYNHIENIGYTGLYFTGSNDTIRFNHIHNYCLTKADGGGIYTYDATGTGRYVASNIVYDGIGNYFGLGYADPSNLFNTAVHGLYMDGGTTGVTLANNTAFNNSTSGLLINAANSNMTATGNMLFNNRVTQLYYSNISTGIIANRNTLFARDSGQLALKIEPGTNLSYLTQDSNYFARPVWEPSGINSNGYTTSPITAQNYHDGAVVYNGVDAKFKSLSAWKTYSSKDAATDQTYATVTDASKIRFEFNATNASVPVSLGSNSYRDVVGNLYTGSVLLAPYTSIVLLNPIAFSTSGGIVIKRKVIR